MYVCVCMREGKKNAYIGYLQKTTLRLKVLDHPQKIKPNKPKKTKQSFVGNRRAVHKLQELVEKV